MVIPRGKSFFETSPLALLPRLNILDLSLNQVNSAVQSLISQELIIYQIEKLPEFGLSSLTMIDLNLNDNMIHYLGGDLWRCEKLRILRLQNNSLSLNAIPETLLAQSFVSTLMLEGNLFETKESTRREY